MVLQSEFVYIKRYRMGDVKSWVIEWFAKNTGLREEEIEGKAQENYFEKGWIDSFKFISLVSEIEETFSISFSNDEFQATSFATIEGLVRTIKEKMD